MLKEITTALTGLALFGLALLIPAVSHASLLLTLEQISNTEISLTASGTFDAATPGEGPDMMVLTNLFDTSTNGWATLTNNSVATDQPSSLIDALVENLGVTGGGPVALFTYFDLGQVAGDIISGSVNITLAGATLLKPVGSTGDVWYGMDDGGSLVTLTGTWEIVGSTVPAPPVILLIGAGLLGLLRRKDRGSVAARLCA